MNRRSLLTTTAVIIPALAAAACGLVPPTTTATAMSDLTIVNKDIAAAGPYIQAFAAALSLVYPTAGAAIAVATPYLNAAEAAFAGISSVTSMAASTAQPTVGTIASNFGKAIGVLTNVINDAPASAGLVKFLPYVTAAQGIVAALTAFAKSGALPTVTVPTAAMVAGVRPVKIWGL